MCRDHRLVKLVEGPIPDSGGPIEVTAQAYLLCAVSVALQLRSRSGSQLYRALVREKSEL